MRKLFKTNLRCGACVAKIAPILDADPAVKQWSADIDSPDKVLTIEGDSIDSRHVADLLAQAGYQTLGEIATPAPTVSAEPETTNFPLLLILLYLLAVIGVIEWSLGGFVWERAMTHFMAGFFLVFSFFKLLNLSAFADSYAMYDIVAQRSRAYALAYPFIELGLGFAYLANVQPIAVNLVTLIVMGVSTIGVIRSLVSKRKIRCACLGAVFNLPMSTVTLIEDLLMAGMAAWMLGAQLFHRIS
jgi:Methylamine utilisation protein MauE